MAMALSKIQVSDPGPSWPSCLAHLSTTCSSGALRMVLCLSCVVNNLFKNCSQNLIPSETLVAMATKIEFFKQFFKNLLLNHWSDFLIISQECSLVTHFKNYSRNFDRSINMALVNGRFLYYMDMKKFLKNL